MAETPNDWHIYTGGRIPAGTRLERLPAPPSWRRSSTREKPSKSNHDDSWFVAERERGATFIPTESAIAAVNAALYLRRPLLLTGSPGVGKSSLISAVAYELELGPVLRWNITSRSTLKNGLYEYDALGRLYAHQQGEKDDIGDFLTIQPLGEALRETTWPRALLVDEIDKGDLDLSNDLLNVIEEGTFEIPELSRIAKQHPEVVVRTCEKGEAKIHGGIVRARQFPFIVLTSNGEREFPAPFLRRCIRHTIERPKHAELIAIVAQHLPELQKEEQNEMKTLVDTFLRRQDEKQEIATDQLLNAVYLVAQRLRQSDTDTKNMIIDLVLKQLTTASAV